MDRSELLPFGILAAAAVLALTGSYYLLETADPDDVAWAEKVNSKVPNRPLRESELKMHGPDATGGIVYGNANSSPRLYCVDFFDGSKRAFVPARGSRENLVALDDAKACET